MKKLFLASACLALLFSSCMHQSQYKIVNKIKLEGDEGWDYLTVDSTTNRLYVSHGDKVQIVDLNQDNKVIGTINGLKHVHGIALADDLGKGYISSGEESMVAIFDLNTMTETKKIAVTGADPDCIVYDKFSHRVFTFNGDSGNATVIDAKTDSVIGTIKLPGGPEFCVADGNGKLYDNIEDKSLVCVINSSTMQVENRWPLAPGESPSGMAIDIKNHRLFSVCHNKIMVIMNADNGKVITTFPIGAHVDGAAFDAGLNRIYSSNGGDGTLTVVQEDSPDTYHLLENVHTVDYARTCTLNPKTHHIYLSVAQVKLLPKKQGEERQHRSIVPGTFEVLDVVPVASEK